jgi:hypothetical protein
LHEFYEFACQIARLPCNCKSPYDIDEYVEQTHTQIYVVEKRKKKYCEKKAEEEMKLKVYVCYLQSQAV